MSSERIMNDRNDPSPVIQKRSKKYVLFDLAILACLIAVGWKLLPGDPAPTSSAPPEPDPAVAVDCKDETCVQIQDKPDQAAATTRHQEDFKIGQTVEVYDPQILPRHTFYAKIVDVNVTIHNSPPTQLAIDADIPSLTPGYDDKKSRTIFGAKVFRAAVRPLKPYEFNEPVICDWSGSQFGLELSPARIVAFERVDNFEFYHVVSFLDGALHYKRVPLARIRKPVDDDSVTPIAATTPTSFFPALGTVLKPGISPPYQYKIDGSNLRFRGVVECYSSKSVHADPVIIWGYKDNVGYKAIHAVHGNSMMPQAEFLHPYHIYEKGTKASCNIGGGGVTGGEGKVYMQRCTVLSHSIRDIGFVYYEVSYYKTSNTDEGNKGDLITESMSFSKVQRFAPHHQ